MNQGRGHLPHLLPPLKKERGSSAPQGCPVLAPFPTTGGDSLEVPLFPHLPHIIAPELRLPKYLLYRSPSCHLELGPRRAGGLAVRAAGTAWPRGPAASTL